MEYGALIFWIVLLVVLLLVEAVTAQLTTIWFAAGAAAALLAELRNLSFLSQLLVFLVVSVTALIATRPIVKRVTRRKIQHTNADRCLGKTAVVVEDVDNLEGRGLVKVDGAVWTARSADGSKLKKDDRVSVEKIEGVKLIVSASLRSEKE